MGQAKKMLKANSVNSYPQNGKNPNNLFLIYYFVKYLWSISTYQTLSTLNTRANKPDLYSSEAYWKGRDKTHTIVEYAWMWLELKRERWGGVWESGESG